MARRDVDQMEAERLLRAAHGRLARVIDADVERGVSGAD
jgi:hypothetical protein